MAKNVFEKVENKERFILFAVKIKNCFVPGSSSPPLFLGNPTWHSHDRSITQPCFGGMSEFNLNVVVWPRYNRSMKGKSVYVFKNWTLLYCQAGLRWAPESSPVDPFLLPYAFGLCLSCFASVIWPFFLTGSFDSFLIQHSSLLLMGILWFWLWTTIGCYYEHSGEWLLLHWAHIFVRGTSIVMYVYIQLY